MAATIIGSPASSILAANAKVLRRQQYQKDINGLETLVETYTVQSQNLISIIPDKDTTHSAFSTATTKYKRMAVESISTSEMDGGISELSVTFVGLTQSSGLPPAIVRIVPVANAGIFGPPVQIQVEFVTDLDENQLLLGMHTKAVPVARSEVKLMPRQINGTELPANPKEPYEQKLIDSYNQTLTTFYLGYVLTEQQCDRRGQFLVATNIYQESGGSRGASIVGQSGFRTASGGSHDARVRPQ